MTIDTFRGEYFFLSNFYEDMKPIEYLDIMYPTVEHGYQAAKTVIESERRRIASLATPGLAKKEGRKLVISEPWDGPEANPVKLDVMRMLVTKKFMQPGLGAMLLATGYEELVEGNWWGDTYWGKCKGEGENWLGRILMDVRSELREVESAQ